MKWRAIFRFSEPSRMVRFEAVFNARNAVVARMVAEYIASQFDGAIIDELQEMA